MIYLLVDRLLSLSLSRSRRSAAVQWGRQTKQSICGSIMIYLSDLIWCDLIVSSLICLSEHLWEDMSVCLNLDLQKTVFSLLSQCSAVRYITIARGCGTHQLWHLQHFTSLFVDQFCSHLQRRLLYLLLLITPVIWSLHPNDQICFRMFRELMIPLLDIAIPTDTDPENHPKRIEVFPVPLLSRDE